MKPAYAVCNTMICCRLSTFSRPHPSSASLIPFAYSSRKFSVNVEARRNRSRHVDLVFPSLERHGFRKNRCGSMAIPLKDVYELIKRSAICADDGIEIGDQSGPVPQLTRAPDPCFATPASIGSNKGSTFAGATEWTSALQPGTSVETKPLAVASVQLIYVGPKIRGVCILAARLSQQTELRKIGVIVAALQFNQFRSVGCQSPGGTPQLGQGASEY